MSIFTNIEEIASLRMTDLSRRPRDIVKAIWKDNDLIALLPDGKWWWSGCSAYEFNNSCFVLSSTSDRWMKLLQGLAALGVISRKAYTSFRSRIETIEERDTHRRHLSHLRYFHKKYGLTLKRDAKLRAYEKLIGEKVYG